MAVEPVLRGFGPLFYRLFGSRYVACDVQQPSAGTLSLVFLFSMDDFVAEPSGLQQGLGVPDVSPAPPVWWSVSGCGICLALGVKDFEEGEPL